MPPFQSPEGSMVRRAQRLSGGRHLPSPRRTPPVACSFTCCTGAKFRIHFLTLRPHCQCCCFCMWGGSGLCTGAWGGGSGLHLFRVEHREGQLPGYQSVDCAERKKTAHRPGALEWRLSWWHGSGVVHAIIAAPFLLCTSPTPFRRIPKHLEGSRRS